MRIMHRTPLIILRCLLVFLRAEYEGSLDTLGTKLPELSMDARTRDMHSTSQVTIPNIFNPLI